ncbi:MAG: flagellar biosynthetic protein FliR [Candidatus Eisenbacteria bacterium]
MNSIDRLATDLPVFLLAGTRVGGVLMLLPVFGRGAIPGVHRVWMTILLSLLLFPLAAPGGVPEAVGAGYIPLVARELSVGMLLGFTVLLFLESAKYAGRIAGVHIGFGLANVIDPVTEEQNTLIDQLQGMMVLVLFLLLGGHRAALLALGKSFQIVPLGQGSISPGLAEGLVRLFCQMIVLGVQIAAPVLASVFLTESVIGVLSRGVPQMNIFTVGLALRIVVGILVLMATMPVFVSLMRGAIESIPLELHGLLGQLAP